jgi:hypothetical protein
MRQPLPALVLVAALALATGLLFPGPPPGASAGGGDAARPEAEEGEGGMPTLRGTEAGEALGRAVRSAGTGASGGPDGDGPSGGEAIRPSLRVDVVDATTGAPVAATWNLGSGVFRAAPSPPGPIDPEALARSAEGAEAARLLWLEGFLLSGSVRDGAFEAAGVVGLSTTIRPPPGYVVEDPAARIRARLAAGVERTRLVVPVWREAVLDVFVSDADGRTKSDVEFGPFLVAGRLREDLQVEAIGPGRFRLRGLPWRPGEPVRGMLAWAWMEGEGDMDMDKEFAILGPALPDALPDAHLVTVMPPDSAASWSVEVRLRGGSCKPLWTLDFDVDLDGGRRRKRFGSATPPERAASLRVRALGWEGAPLRDGTISLGGEERTTDAEGLAVFSEVAPGEHAVELRARGRFAARGRATLVEGEAASIELREPAGGTLEVLVTDEDGRPYPHALLDLGPTEVFDVVDGEQRLDLRTDVRGRRRLERVEPGSVTVLAEWGSRRGEESVDLRDGDTRRVHLVLR